MKILFILSALMLATAQANFFENLGNSLKGVFSTLGNAVMHELDTTGVQLLNAGLEAGKSLVSQGVQALALNTASALQNKDKPATRDLSLNQVETVFHGLVDSLGLSLKGSLKHFSSRLKDVMEKAGDLKLSPQELVQEVDKLVATHNVLADALLKAVETKGADIVSGLIHKSKRNAFTDFFSGVGSHLSDLFQPMVDGVKNMATNAGTALKTGGTALLSAVKESASQLGDKLKPHIAALGNSLGQLAQQGSNALSALKDASGDILAQTLQNAKEPLHQMVNTMGNAGQTVASHVAGTLGSVTGTLGALAGTATNP